MSDKPIEATRSDIAERARRHYDEVSAKACERNSTIPHAIDAWEREPDLTARITGLESQLAQATARADEMEAERAQTIARLDAINANLEQSKASLAIIADQGFYDKVDQLVAQLESVTKERDAYKQNLIDAQADIAAEIEAGNAARKSAAEAMKAAYDFLVELRDRGWEWPNAIDEGKALIARLAASLPTADCEAKA